VVDFMKKLIYIVIPLIMLILLFASCALVEPKAEVTITSTNVGDYGGGDYYMEIYYTIVNTGLYDIASYDITFEVTCTDSTVFTLEEWGGSLDVDDSYSSWCYVDTGSKYPDSAWVKKVELEKM
jgi:hypothetical protein